MKSRAQWVWLFAASVGLLTVCVSWAQDARLLPEAQKAFDSGLQAVTQQQWQEAIRDFTEAQKLGGNDPRILFNIALAHSKFGHELQAIAWFNVYLAAVPDAENASAVRREIIRLKEAVQDRIARLYALAKQAVEKRATSPFNASTEFNLIAERQEQLGDFVTATETRRAGYDAEVTAALARLQSPDRTFSIDLPRMRQRLANALALERSFDEAAEVARTLAPAKRDEVSALIVELLVKERYEAPENIDNDLRRAETLVHSIGDEKTRAATEELIRVVKLERQINEAFSKGVPDAALMDRYAAENPIALVVSTWQRIAVHHIRKKDFGAAEIVLSKIAEFPQAGDVITGLQASLALAYLEAGRRSDATNTARRLLANLEKGDKGSSDPGYSAKVAVAKATLGDLSSARQLVYKMQRAPYQIWTGAPDYIGYYRSGFGELFNQEFVIGAIAFCAAAAGRVEEALKIAGGYSSSAEFQLAYTNVAYWYVLQNQPSKALDLLKSVPLTHTMASLGKAQLLGVILQQAIKRDDLTSAERAFSDMPPSSKWTSQRSLDFQYRVEAALLLAGAYRNRNDSAKAKRYIDIAKNIVSAGQLDAELQKATPNHFDDLLERIAIAQEQMADAAGAQRTRGEKLRPAPKNVQLWISMASKDGWLNSDELLEPDKRVREIHDRGQFVASGLADLAKQFGSVLRRLERLERETGGVVAAAHSAMAPDQRVWDAIRKRPDINMLRAFLAQFPTSPFTEDAKTQLAVLEQPKSAPTPNSRLTTPTAPTPSLRIIGRSETSEDLAFSPDGNRLVSAHVQISWWDVASGKLIRKSDKLPEQPSERFRSVAFLPDGRFVIAAGDDRNNNIRLFDAESGALIRSVKVSEYNGLFHIPKIAVSPDGRHFATNFWTKTVNVDGIKLFDATDGQLVRTFATSRSVRSIALSPEGQQVAGTIGKLIGVWDIQTGQLARTLAGHDESVMAVSFSPDGRWLASGSDDKSVKIWNTKTGDLVRTLATGGEVRHVAFSPDARFIGVASSDQPVTVWNLETGQLQLALESGKPVFLAVAFSPDGRFLAASSYDGIYLWPLKDSLGTITPIARPATSSVPVLRELPEPERKEKSAGLGSALPNVAADAAAWIIIKDTLDAAVLRRFIEQFPNSPRRSEAESRLERLANLPVRKTEPESPRGRGHISKGTRTAVHPKSRRTGVAIGRSCFMFNGRQVCE